MQDSEIQNFAQTILEQTYDLAVLAPVNADAARAEVEAELRNQLALNAAATKRARHAHFAVPGTSEESYGEKLFELDSARPFLAGIRHAGGNPKLPFVNVSAGFALTGSNFAAVRKILRREFAAFGPTSFSLWMKPAAETSYPQFPAARRYLARRFADLDLIPREKSPFELRPVEGSQFYDWYENEYRLFHEGDPSLKSWVPINERSEMERYQSQGLLYGAYRGTELAGLIAGEGQPLLGLAGLYVAEILVGRAHKGKGYAARIQREFLAKVRPPFEVVWGTIDARNEPSTRTALSVGRLPVRTEFFVPLN